MNWLFFRTSAPKNELKGAEEEVVPELVEIVTEDIVLSEKSDEEKQKFLQDLIDQNVRLAELKESDRLRFIASLPKEFDSMEMISAEASLKTRLSASINEAMKEANKLIEQAMKLNYGHSQYSDSDDEEESIFEVSNEMLNGFSSESEESVELTLDEAIEGLVGAPIVREKSQQIFDETYEVIEAETETY